MMSRVASGFALVLSGVGLVRSQLDLSIVQTSAAAMSPPTAVTFMLAAIALWLETRPLDRHRPIRWLAWGAAGLALLVGLATTAGVGTSSIARDTGICFVLLSAALLLLDWDSRPGFWPAQFIL